MSRDSLRHEVTGPPFSRTKSKLLSPHQSNVWWTRTYSLPKITRYRFVAEARVHAGPKRDAVSVGVWRDLEGVIGGLPLFRFMVYV